MTFTRRRLIIFCAGLGVTLLMAGLLPFIALAQEATPEATPLPPGFYDIESISAIEPTGNNSYCAVCHSQPLQVVTLTDGYILNLYVSPEIIANSVHGSSSEQGALGCVDCHGQDSFPHSGPTPEDQRLFSLSGITMCIGCHVEQADELQHGLHEQAIARGNTSAAVCTDCHGAHDIRAVASFPELVAGVCGDCHETSLAEWRASPHVDIGPLDCATCHSPHTQAIRGGVSTTELCINCHKEMPEVWVHVQHTEVDPAVECADCHMYQGTEHELATVASLPSTESTGHTMNVETVPCTTCHTELAQTVALEATPQPVVEEPPVETVEQVSEGGTGDFIQLLQGLILGLGFGATLAAVFVSRGNRR
ncbi:MAG: cytochrome c3 family protein [Anaerolineae bacterium]|nr:cytochrome c3 family protein [Anaerolineae bacterium]